MLGAVIGSVLLVCIFAAETAHAQLTDDALAELGRRVALRLAPGETVRFTHRNLSSLDSTDAQRAYSVFENTLKRRSRRNSTPVEVTFTISENRKGYVLVAETRRGGEREVDIVSSTVVETRTRSRLALSKQLLWEQPEPILDLAISGDRLLVLQPG